MRDKNVIALAAAVVVAAVVLVRKKVGAGGATAPGFTLRIKNPALPGQAGYGWQYFSDGTSIGPDGTYYQGGAAVWSPQQ